MEYVSLIIKVLIDVMHPIKNEKCMIILLSHHQKLPKAAEELLLMGYHFTVKILMIDATPTRCRATTESPLLQRPFVLPY